MNDRSDPSLSPAAASVQMIMYGAFAVSHLLIAAIGVYSNLTNAIAPVEGVMDTMFPVLGFVAVTALVGIFTVVPMLLWDNDYLVFMLLRFAFAESITIFGLVLCMSGVPLEYCAAFWGVGLATHLTLAPTQRDRELHVQRRAERRAAK